MKLMISDDNNNNEIKHIKINNNNSHMLIKFSVYFLNIIINCIVLNKQIGEKFQFFYLLVRYL